MADNNKAIMTELSDDSLEEVTGGNKGSFDKVEWCETCGKFRKPVNGKCDVCERKLGVDTVAVQKGNAGKTRVSGGGNMMC